MEAITTLTGYEVKTGQGQRGPWSMHLFKDAAGVSFQTFDSGLGNRAAQLLHQTVRLVYEPETNQRGYTNNVLKAIEIAAGGTQPTQAFAPQPAPQLAPAPQQRGNDPEREERIMRQSGAKVAVELIGFFPEDQRTLNNLVLISESLVKYFTAGPNALLPAPVAAPVGVDPSLAAPAGVGGPEQFGFENQY